MLTILIPTYNRCKSLEKVLHTYCQQKYLKEIIIVDDGSTDNTRAMLDLSRESSTIPIRVIHNTFRRGQQFCRHLALSNAVTEWVLFGEDDVWLEPDYCEILLREAKELNADIIAGRLVTAAVGSIFSHDDLVDIRQNSPMEICDMVNLEGNFDAYPSQVVKVPFLHTISLIKKDVFNHIGFDEWYKGGAQREETDFYIQANSSGYKVYFSPSTLCFHLRGPHSALGGQRINRILVEYYFVINTWHMISKHWKYLKSECHFKGSPLIWMVGYFMRREYLQFKRVVSGDYVSSFKKKI
jgi:glycosyltransferase involved in cell wall biosynthesis